MNQENIDKKNPTLIEYEKIIKELRNENERLKMRVLELEEEIRVLLGQQESSTEVAETEIQYEPKTPISKREVIVSNSEFSQDTIPLEMGKGPIVEGISRRECPICGNNNKALIHEIIDRSHLISSYPKLYGKKYKCGNCGREWRISHEA